ncbi:hypothetical protein BKA59DRAFT_447837 [Fusarium tricinctum]|uniref:Carbonic anhydrase n=1 Tax=Fusarium tricinctum TaxID=61284 RepID=A0A8K0S5N3_9HYPO|nr:hypothetical protein BKA59DRAFT_447837 [Fusarium tricinctum]
MDNYPNVEELLRRNAERVQTFKPIPYLSELDRLPAEKKVPMPKIFIDAVVTRGAAGRIAHQFNNLLFLDHVLQFTDVMIIHHTDCSAELFSNEEVYQELRRRAPHADDQIKDITLPGYKELERSVQEDIELVKASPLVRKELADRTQGFIYDIKTGEVKPVTVRG